MPELSLITLLEKAKGHKMTPFELWHQRLSFIIGQMPHSEDYSVGARKRYTLIHHYTEQFGECPPRNGKEFNPYA